MDNRFTRAALASTSHVARRLRQQQLGVPSRCRPSECHEPNTVPERIKGP